MKNFLGSKTIWGTVIAVVPTLLGPFVGAEDGTLVTQSIDQIITGIGGLLAVYGRFVARGPLALL